MHQAPTGSIWDAKQLAALDRGQTETIESLAVHVDEHKSVLLMFAHIAEQHAGAVVPVAERKLIEIGTLVSWSAFQDNEWLYLTNLAGQELHNSTVLVEIQGRDGQTVDRTSSRGTARQWSMSGISGPALACTSNAGTAGA